MDKCNFLRQKKQVNINGEWVDTRSYRYIPLRDAGDKSLIVINGGEPNDKYLLRTYYADRKRWEYLISTDNNGNKIYDVNDGTEIVGIFNVAKEEDTKRCESVQLFNVEIKSISGYYHRDYVGNYEHLLDIRTAGSIDTKALKIYCSELIDYGNHGWDEGYGNFKNGKFDEIYLEPSAISGLTFMKGMFESCENLKSLDTSNWNSHFVTDMSRMFMYCASLTSLNLSGLETSHVENMDYMFAGCESLTSLDLSNFNTVSLSSMTSMFDMDISIHALGESTKLTSLNLSSFDTSNVDKMDNMFRQCSALTSLDVSSFDTSDVKNMIGMFERCSGLISLDLSNFNTHWVRSMKKMFNMVNYDGSIHTNLASLDLSGWNLDKLYNDGTENMFDGCIELKTIRMVGCNDNTIRTIRAALDSAGILDQVTIIT